MHWSTYIGDSYYNRSLTAGLSEGSRKMPTKSTKTGYKPLLIVTSNIAQKAASLDQQPAQT